MLAAFCPIFRLHGNRGGPKDKDICGATGFNEVWTFGDTAYGAISSVMRLREDLRDYVHVNLRRAHDDGTPLLRPMVFEFSDPACENATDQFMFGDSWLVAPVLSYGSKSQRVYLPKLPTGSTGGIIIRTALLRFRPAGSRLRPLVWMLSRCFLESSDPRARSEATVISTLVSGETATTRTHVVAYGVVVTP